MRNVKHLLTVLLLAQPAFAVDVAPTKALDLSNIPIPNDTVTRAGGNARFRLTLSCYATNLRGTANPLAKESTVVTYFDYTDMSGNPQTIVISYLALLASAEGSAPQQVVHNTASVYPDVNVAAHGNVVEVDFAGIKTVPVSADGTVQTTGSATSFKALNSVRFDQLGAPGGQYVGHDGPLSASVSWTASPDGRTFDIHASFPGAAFVGQGAVYLGERRTGYCGGYYSPLMLFFDDARPKFSATSTFKVAPGSDKIYWVEKSAPGYFLALDVNGNGKIDSGDELFGDTQMTNGFAALEKYDDNKDGAIDAKDKVFKKLVLWRDQNSDGVSQKAEMVSLAAMGVTSISVKAKVSAGSFSTRAKYDRVSTFKFKDRSGKIKDGAVIDILFGNAPKD